MFINFFRVVVSVISLCVLCKPLFAEEHASFWEGFRVGGYSSADLRIPRTEPTQLKLNEISMIVTWDQGTRVKFFSELELENPVSYDHHLGLHSKQSYVDLERFYLDYSLSEKSNVRVGRFLNPVGRWNQLHAPPLVWTASRPLVTTELFPAALNGLMLFGNVPLQERSLEYQVYAEGLKDQRKERDERTYRDVKGARFAINNIFNFASENAGLNTLGLNLASYQEDRPGAPTYRLIGIDFLLEFDRWELSGEAYSRNTSQGKDAGSGAYLQSAYLIRNDWYWITRLENLHYPAEQNAERWVLGATKRLKPNQLLKFEFTGGSGEYEDIPRGFTTSFAVMF